MAENSKIEWTHHTFNPWRGCTKVSPGCENCYAETMSGRNPAVLGVWGKYGTRVVASESMWKQPLKWNKAAELAGERRRVFCASLADVFEWKDTMPPEAWESVMEARMRLFQLIDATPHLDWLLLTKRPEKVRHIMDEITLGTYGNDVWNFRDHMPNIWIGTSVEDQKTADERIPHLLRIPAKIRFLSMEPLLGPVDVLPFLKGWTGKDSGLPSPLSDALKSLPDIAGINLGIVGGESGHNARPMHPDWARSIRDQCNATGVPFFFKQWGEFVSPEQFDSSGYDDVLMGDSARMIDPDGQSRSASTALPAPNSELVWRLGKKKAGRLLDERTWDEMPS